MKRGAFLVRSPHHRALRALNYAPEIDALRSAGAGADAVPLGDLVADFGLGYATVFARLDASPQHGVELLSQADMFAAEPAGRWIRRDSMSFPDRHEVRRWQILIAGAGTLGENELYGRSIIADARLAGRHVGQDTLTLGFAPAGSDLNLFVYAFLTSPTGVKALRSCSYGTKILRIRKDLLAELPVPVPDPAVLRRVAALVRTTVAQRERYATSLKAARAVLEKRPEVQAAHTMCARRRARCISWTGDLPTMGAWNFASTGGALGLLSATWKGRVADLVQKDGLFNGPRFVRTSCEPPHGIEFFSQRDVFMMRPVPQRIARPGIPSRLLFVRPDTILAGSHGQMSEGSLFGRVELAAFAAHKGGLTQDILRIQPRPGAGQVLYSFLSTPVGQRLFKSTAVGTSIPSVRIDLLARLPVPDLASEEADRITAAVNGALAARLAATEAEQEAIRIVEAEVIPRWLG